jgi:hypothetical protein
MVCAKQQDHKGTVRQLMLLKFHVLIARDERVKTSFLDSKKQRSVLEGSPAACGHRSHFVPGQMAAYLPGNAFVTDDPFQD